MPLDRHKTVKQALEYVARNPEWPPDHERLDMPLWEAVGRQLYEHANFPDPRVVGSLGRSLRAQKIILNRTTGRRRTGTHPAVRNSKQVKFRDLTAGADEGTSNDE